MIRRLALAFALALLPSGMKIAMLRRMGAKVGKNCYIGMTLIDARDIDIGDHVRIAGFNLMHRLGGLQLSDGSRLKEGLINTPEATL